MKRLTKIFHILLGVTTLILATIIAIGRIAWRTIRKWWKNRSKRSRIVLASILILIPVGFVALTAYAYYDSEYGRDFWNYKELSEDVEAHYFRDGKYRIYNYYTGEYTTSKINWVSYASADDSLAVYALPYKRGYINVNNGKVVIDAKKNDYRKAWVFSEGLAAVMKDNKIGFINMNNEVVIPFQFEYTHECDIVECSYVFHNGYSLMTNKDGDLGLIDKNGSWVVKATYDDIYEEGENGHRIIVNDMKQGVLDSMFNIVYPTEYDNIKVLSDGFILSKGGKMWQVDFEGNIIHPFMFEETYHLNYPLGYNDNGDLQYVLADYAVYEIRNYYGIMNRITGKPITPALYLEINMLSKDLFKVQVPESCDWCLIDTKGNIVSK